MEPSPLIAHTGHPAEWLPFVGPIILLALAWLFARAREAAGGEDTESEDAAGTQRGDHGDPPAGEEAPEGRADRGGDADGT